MELTNRHKITILYAEGMAEDFVAAYFMCVDMGEFTESEALRHWCHSQDKMIREDNLSRKEYLARTGSRYL
jgi:hypothetical protein